MKYLVLILIYVKLFTKTRGLNAKMLGLNVVMDISKFNTFVEFDKIRDDGIQAVFHKATFGTKWIDSKFEERKKQALEIGLLWGAYHSGNGNSGVLQAYHFLKTVGCDNDTLLALFTEEPKKGLAMKIEQIENFISIVKVETARLPLIYGSIQLMDAIKGKDTILRECPLWLVEYSDEARLVEDSWKNWTLWQYTNGSLGPLPHVVTGVGRCNRDVINDALYEFADKMWAEL